MCVESGALEAQAVLLVESLREFGGRFRDAPVWAVSPRPGRRPGTATVAALEALDVRYLDETLDTGCPEYGPANRVAAAARVEEIAGTDFLAVLDSDTFFTAEPAAFALPPGVDAAARPVDVKGICTRGTGDPCDDYWQRLCAACGVSYDRLPWVSTATGDATVKASYNGGLVVVRSGLGLFARGLDFFRLAVRRGLVPPPTAPVIRSSTGVLSPDAARWWGSSQATLALALWAGDGAATILPPGYNHPLHLHARLPAELRAAARAALVHVHYHHLLDADALPADEVLGAAGPLGGAQRAWLCARVPLAPPEAPRPRPSRRIGRPLIVAGMHRSATSLVTSALRRAGVDTGVDHWAGRGNPRGHFEDRDFHRLHEDLLAAAGHTCFDAEGDLVPAPGSELARRARELVAARRELPLWGWKNPRACLVLDLWDALLPEAGYVFLVRHPLDVALSLWRRNTEDELRRDPLLAVRSWQVHNERLLAFAERHRERCLIAHVPAATRDLEGLVRRVAERFDLPLAWQGVGALFDEPSLAPRLDLLDPLAEREFPEAMRLFRRLEAMADVPGPAVAASAPDDPATAAAHTAVPSDAGVEVILDSVFVLLLERRRLAAEEARELDALRAAVAASRADLAAERASADELRRELDATAAHAADLAAHCQELIATLQAIESSRAFFPIRWWWRFRRRLDLQSR